MGEPAFLAERAPMAVQIEGVHDLGGTALWAGSHWRPRIDHELHAPQPSQLAHRPVPVAVVERYAVPVAGLLVDGGHSTGFDNDFVAEVSDVVEDGLV